jgi:hypothetical protein
VARAALIGVINLFCFGFRSVREWFPKPVTMRSVVAPEIPGRDLGVVISPGPIDNSPGSSQFGSCDEMPLTRRLTMSRKSEDIICKHHTAQYLGTRQADVDRANRMRPI